MSRRSTYLVLVVAAFALFAAACGSDSGADTTTTSATATTEASTTSEATTTTTTSEATTTTEAVTTTSTAPGAAALAISEIGFGSAGYVEITNVGDSVATLDGLWLCQQPSYHELSGSLDPGESIRIDAADSRYGDLDAGAGAMGLYISADFGSPDAIIGYVAWGPSGHGRLNVAISAGVWTEDSSVDAAGALLISTTEPAPISAEGWATG